MALQGDRQIVETDISFVLNTPAQRGIIVCYGVAGSGAAFGDAGGAAVVPSGVTGASGLVPIGLLLNDFVNIDQTIQHRNFMKDQQVVGERCTLLRMGWVVTNMISGSPAPTPTGRIAYCIASGVLSPTVDANGGLTATPKVGEFMSTLDQNGYAKVAIKLPIV